MSGGSPLNLAESFVTALYCVRHSPLPLLTLGTGIKLPYAGKFSRHEIFAVSRLGRIFTILFSRFTTDRFSRFFVHLKLPRGTDVYERYNVLL